MFLVIETTSGTSVADGARFLVDAADAAAAAQSVAERGTWVGRRSFQVFDAAAGTAASFEATLSVLPVEEPAPNPEG